MSGEQVISKHRAVGPEVHGAETEMSERLETNVLIKWTQLDYSVRTRILMKRKRKEESKEEEEHDDAILGAALARTHLGMRYRWRDPILTFI